MSYILIKNGSVVFEKEIKKADVLIKDGYIVPVKDERQKYAKLHKNI